VNVSSNSNVDDFLRIFFLKILISLPALNFSKRKFLFGYHCLKEAGTERNLGLVSNAYLVTFYKLSFFLLIPIYKSEFFIVFIYFDYYNNYFCFFLSSHYGSVKKSGS